MSGDLSEKNQGSIKEETTIEDNVGGIGGGELSIEDFNEVLNKKDGIEELREYIEERKKAIVDAYKSKGLTEEDIVRESRTGGSLVGLQWFTYKALLHGINYRLDMLDSSIKLDDSVIDLGPVNLYNFFEHTKRMVEFLNGNNHLEDIDEVQKKESDSEKEVTDDESSKQETQSVQEEIKELHEALDGKVFKVGENGSLEEVDETEEDESDVSSADLLKLKTKYREAETEMNEARGKYYAGLKTKKDIDDNDSDEFMLLKEKEKAFLKAQAEHGAFLSKKLSQRKETREDGSAKWEYENEKIKSAFAKRFVVKYEENQRKIRDESLAENDALKNKYLEVVKGFFEKVKKNKTSLKVGSLIIVGGVAGITGGVTQIGTAITARVLGRVVGGAITAAVVGKGVYAIFGEGVEWKEERNKSSVRINEFNIDNIKEARRKYKKKADNIAVAKKAQVGTSVALAGAAAMAVGASVTESVSDTVDSFSEALDTPTPENVVLESPSVDDNSINSYGDNVDDGNDSIEIISDEPVETSVDIKEVSVEPTSPSETVSVAPNEITDEQITEQNLSDVDGDIESGSFVPHEAEGGGSVDEDGNFTIISEDLGPEVVAPNSMYEVNGGDNLWDILEGDVDGREMSDVLNSIPEEHRTEALIKLFSTIDESPELQKSIGLISPPNGINPSDYVQAGQEINITELENALTKIAGNAGEDWNFNNEIIMDAQPNDVISDIDGASVNDVRGIQDTQEWHGEDIDIEDEEDSVVPPVVSEEITIDDMYSDGDEHHALTDAEENTVDNKELLGPTISEGFEEAQKAFIEDHLGKSSGGFFGIIKPSNTAFDAFEKTDMDTIQNMSSDKINSADVSDKQWNDFSDMIEEMQQKVEIKGDEQLGSYVKRYVEATWKPSS